jgi:chromosome segregation protein
LDLRTAQERLTTTENRLAGLQRAARAEEAAAKSAAAAAEKRTRQRAVALEVAARATDGLALMERSLAEATQMRDLAQHNAQEQGEQRILLRASRDTLDTATRSNTIALHEVELALAELRADATTLERRAVDDYALSPAQVTDQYGPMELVPAYVFPKVRGGVGEEESPLAADLDPSVVFSRDAVEKAHDKAVRVLASMGKVNPLALEEYAALEERHRFLSEQLGDLKRSRADLLGLIDDIDAKVLEVFESAFMDTAKQFESVFSRLFPGGEGKMYLTDPDDMLNTGIEIEARPAGKKVKRLSLLSGGERSLTAIAMLVSIFKARPSPFYVMDEVEAALDDINLGRLLGVFRELQEDSQLIVISHQKRTMEIADALYGVTMAGNGVSSVMGTRLQPQET